MSEHSLEWNCEELIMAKMMADPRFSDQIFRHHEDDRAAEIDVFIFKATKGENQLEGAKGYAVRVAVTFASGTLSPDASDQLANAVSEAVYSPDPFVSNLPDLVFAHLEPDGDTQRMDTKKLRKRVVTFPLIAKTV